MTDDNKKLVDLRVDDLADVIDHVFSPDEYINTSCCAAGDKVYWFGTMRSGGVYMMVFEGTEIIAERLVAE
jgi:hypothetical protein